MEVKTQTVGQWLEALASGDSSTEQDGTKMQNLLHRIGFPSAVVTCGIVYTAGKGTLVEPPTDIHSIARALVKTAARG